MKEISIAVCTDENYALNAAIALYSAVYNVKEGTRIKAYIIDNGIYDETKDRFERIMEKTDLDIIWLKPDLSVFDDLALSSWTTKVVHARLLLPDIVSEDIEKILYLDADMLVLEDLTKLWDIPLDNNVLFASESLVSPLVDDRPNSSVLVDAGMNQSSSYFSAALLLINIAEWNKHDLLSKYIKILNKIGTEFIYRNQDPMNVILEDKWEPLDKHWQVVTPYYFSSIEEHQRVAQNANIIHFTGSPPGFPKCNHPKENLFFQYLKQSNWFSEVEYIIWRLKLVIKRVGYDIYSKLKKMLKGVSEFIKKNND